MIKRIVFFFCIIGLAGCRMLNPSVMLKTPRDFKYNTPPQQQEVVYKISANDQLEFKMYTNDGFKIIDLTTLASDISSASAGYLYTVEFDGTVRLPVLGRIVLQGMTVREAESMLEQRYSEIYKNPFVLLKVTNRRVIIFPGNEGGAKVVPLTNNNTTLLEALALAGGITQQGKAYKVKLIRGDLKNPQVYLIDLSTISGIKQADLVLQANDIIYIEPKLRIGKDVMGEISPYLAFITTLILFFSFFSKGITR